MNRLMKIFTVQYVVPLLQIGGIYLTSAALSMSDIGACMTYSTRERETEVNEVYRMCCNKEE